MPASQLVRRWAANQTTFGAVVRLGEPWTVEALSHTEFDYLLFDCQHGLVPEHHLVQLLRILNGTSMATLVKVPANDEAVIGRVLDYGADGVIVPMVETAEQARRAVAACRHGPDGVRSYGTLRLQMLPGGASRPVLCVPMIETELGARNCEEIAAVPGVDAIYVGPADLALSLGMPPKQGLDVAPLDELVSFVLAACAAGNVPVGIAGDPAAMIPYGFRIISVGTDATFFLSGLRAAENECRRVKETADIHAGAADVG
jgi:4-hydroxy-2-oxoheptanedioate aldolase